MRKLILANFQSPGDVVMLTGALRDLHRNYPGEFVTDVKTFAPELWENNPYITKLAPSDTETKIVVCHYPLIHRSNQQPVHFLYGFIEFLNEKLQLRIRPTAPFGDIHLSLSEKAEPSLVEQVTGADVPYWIICAGGKYDFTIKWWHFRRWQSVVDHFKNQLLFVQVGERHHYHPPLSGALDLRGKTSIRKLIQLVYRAQGVLCPVTFLMHLAAAVETPTPSHLRGCVVVAGGRESPSWEAYSTHQFIHTVGSLPCCATGGCWRSRTVPFADGDEKDNPDHLCLDVVGGLPRCMDHISVEDVIRRIEYFLAGPRRHRLNCFEASAIRPFLRIAPNWDLTSKRTGETDTRRPVEPSATTTTKNQVA